MLPNRQFHQSRRIGFGRILPQAGQGRFIAGKLHILGGKSECQPDHGVEPVDTGRQQRKQTDEMVPPPDMHQFMQNHAGCLFFRHLLFRQDNPRPKEADNQRAAGITGAVQPDRPPEWVTEHGVAAFK